MKGFRTSLPKCATLACRLSLKLKTLKAQKIKTFPLGQTVYKGRTANNPPECQCVAVKTSSHTSILLEVEWHIDNYCFKVMFIVFNKIKSKISHPYGNHLSWEKTYLNTSEMVKTMKYIASFLNSHFIFLNCKKRLLFWELLIQVCKTSVWQPGQIPWRAASHWAAFPEQAAVSLSFSKKKPPGTHSYLGHRKTICAILQLTTFITDWSHASLSFTHERWWVLEGRAQLSVLECSLFSQPSRDQAAPLHSLLKNEDLEFR